MSEIISTNEFILRVLANLRLLSSDNIYYFIESGYGDYSTKKITKDALRVVLNRLEKNDKLVEFYSMNSLFKYGTNNGVAFSDVPLEGQKRKIYMLSSPSISKNGKDMINSRSGARYADLMNYSESKLSSVMSFNYPIYAYLNTAFLPKIDCLNYVFDAGLLKKGLFKAHQIHALASFWMPTISEEVGPTFQNMRIAIKYIPRSEIKLVYLNFLRKHLFNRSKNYDWVFFVFSDKLRGYKKEVVKKFVELTSKENVYYFKKRIKYNDHPELNNLKKNLIPKNLLSSSIEDKEPYTGGCPISLIHYEDLFNKLKSGHLSDLVV